MFQVGLIVPYSDFLRKQYIGKISSSVKAIQKKNYKFLQKYSLTDQQVCIKLSPECNASPS